MQPLFNAGSYVVETVNGDTRTIEAAGVWIDGGLVKFTDVDGVIFQVMFSAALMGITRVDSAWENPNH